MTLILMASLAWCVCAWWCHPWWTGSKIPSVSVDTSSLCYNKQKTRAKTSRLKHLLPIVTLLMLIYFNFILFHSLTLHYLDEISLFFSYC